MKITYDTLINKNNVRRLNNIMWSDHIRNQAFSHWMDSVDLENKVILDAGSGWGLLGEYALEKGARHVVQVEYLSDRVALLDRWKLNSKFKDKVTVIEANLLDDWDWPSTLPQPDFILHEFVGRRFLNENLHKILPNLYAKFPQSKFLPDCAQYKVHYCSVSDNPKFINKLLFDYKKSKEKVTFSPGISVSDKYIDFIQSEINNSLDKNIFWCQRPDYVSFENSSTYTDVKPDFLMFSRNHPYEVISKVPKNFQGFCMLSYCFGTKDAMFSSGFLNISDGLVSYLNNDTTEIIFTYKDRNNWWYDDWDVSCR